MGQFEGFVFFTHLNQENPGENLLAARECQTKTCLPVRSQPFGVAWRLPPFPAEKACVVQCWLSLPLDPWDLIQGGILLRWHKVLPFLQSWSLGVAIQATRGLKSCRADWEIEHIICPWNFMWHNMTPGHLYEKVNISAWQLDKSGQGSRQSGFILASEKKGVVAPCGSGVWRCV